MDEAATQPVLSGASQNLPTQPANSNPVPNQLQGNEENTSKLPFITIGTILIVLAGGYIAFQIMKPTQNDQPTTNLESNEERSIIDAKQPSDTQNLKKYTNNKYFYSFEYPSDMKLQVDTNEDALLVGGATSLTRGTYSRDQNYQLIVVQPVPLLAKDIDRAKLDSNILTTQTYYVKRSMYDSTEIGGTVEFGQLTATRAPNIDVDEVSSAVFDKNENDPSYSSAKVRMVFVVTKNYIYFISTFYQNQTDLETFEDFLSTIKFTDK